MKNLPFNSGRIRKNLAIFFFIIFIWADLSAQNSEGLYFYESKLRNRISKSEITKIFPKIERSQNIIRLDFTNILPHYYEVDYCFFSPDNRYLNIVSGQINESKASGYPLKTCHIIDFQKLLNKCEVLLPGDDEYNIAYSTKLSNDYFLFKGPDNYLYNIDSNFEVNRIKLKNPIPDLILPYSIYHRNDKVYVYGLVDDPIDELAVIDGNTGKIIRKSILFQTNSDAVETGDFISSVLEEAIKNPQILNLKNLKNNYNNGVIDQALTNLAIDAFAELLFSKPSEAAYWPDLAINANGTILAQVSLDRINLWAVSKSDPSIINTEKPIFSLNGVNTKLIELNISADDQFLILSYPDKTQIYSTLTGEHVVNFTGRFLGLHPKYNIVAMNYNGRLWLYSIEGSFFSGWGVQLPFFTKPVECSRLRGIFSPDGKYFVANSNICYDGTGKDYYDKFMAGSSKESLLCIYDIEKLLDFQYGFIKNEIASKFDFTINDIVLKSVYGLFPDSLKKLVSEQSLLAPKDEYETSEQFNKRKQTRQNGFVSKIANMYESSHLIKPGTGDLGGFYYIKKDSSVIAVFYNSPATKAGVKVGDKYLSTGNDITVKQASTNKVLTITKAPYLPGTIDSKITNKRYFWLDSVGKYNADNSKLRIYSMNYLFTASIPAGEAKEVKNYWEKVVGRESLTLTANRSVDKDLNPSYSELFLINNINGKSYKVSIENKIFELINRPNPQIAQGDNSQSSKLQTVINNPLQNNSIVIECLKQNKMITYNGNKPPNLSNTYTTENMINTNASEYIRTLININGKMNSIFRLFDQTASGKISFSEKQPTGAWADGKGCYITGENQNFTIWMENSLSNGAATVFILSGTLEQSTGNLLNCKSMTVYIKPAGKVIAGDWYSGSGWIQRLK